MTSNLPSYGPDPLFSTLSPQIQACITSPSQSCDQTMASYCSTAPASNYTICSCINSPLPCPTFSNPVCANSPFSYVPTKYAPGSSGLATCQQMPICVNYIETEGANNVAGHIIQNCSAQNIGENDLANYPILLGIGLLLFIILLIYIIVNFEIKNSKLGGSLKSILGRRN